MIRCPSCGALNRVAWDQVERGRQPICGRCKKPLPLAATPVTVTDATFSSLVERAAEPVVVDMWAPWCGPCRMIAPVIDELASQLGEHVLLDVHIGPGPRRKGGSGGHGGALLSGDGGSKTSARGRPLLTRREFSAFISWSRGPG